LYPGLRDKVERRTPVDTYARQDLRSTTGIG